MKELFTNKVFKIIMITDIIQQMCIWVRNIAILFYIIEKTGSNPIAVSLITVFEYLPMFVFSYIGGTLADRWNPKTTMIIGDFLSGLSVFCILFMVSQGLWQAVFAITLISSIVTQFSVPSSVIMFRRNINENLLTPAISFSQALQSLYIIIGPIIGTLFYTSLGINFSLTIIAFMFLTSSIVQFLLPSSQNNTNCIRKSLLYEMKEGISFIKHNSGIKTICTVLAILGIAEGLIQPLTIFILTDRLMIEKESLQWFFTLTGVGLLFGALLSALIASRFKTRIVLFCAMMTFSIITAIEVLSKNIFLTATMYFLSGTALAFVQVAISSPLIKNVKEEFVGRINGLITPLLTGGILIGSSLSGVLIKQIQLIPLFLTSSGIMIICGVISLNYKENH